MVLKLKPDSQNSYPLEAILIRDARVSEWILEMQRMDITLEDVKLYPVPDRIANQIWGCLIVTRKKMGRYEIGRNEYCQRVSSNLFIPEKSSLNPAIGAEECEKLFSAGIHLFHPVPGLVHLEEALNFSDLLSDPVLKDCILTQAEEPAFVPKEVKSFRIKAVSPEEVLQDLEKNAFPKRKKLETKSLTWIEQLRLLLYKSLIGKGENAAKKGTVQSFFQSLGQKATSLLGQKFSRFENLSQKMDEDYEDLKKRNETKMNQLLEFLKNNPAEALKYAIPLDDYGVSRGSKNGEFSLEKRWFDFSLFGSPDRSASGNVDIGEHYGKLQTQYHSMAEEFIRQKEIMQAAFVYMKLLKNPWMAASTLQNGHFYLEAATIFLKNLNNKEMAAACYEKGNMTEEAIQLYHEMGQNEKAGDLYVSIGKRTAANISYGKVANSYITSGQYVKAALIYRNKMLQPLLGQNILLQGWNQKKDPVNCLNNFLANIPDVKQLGNQIKWLYTNNVNEENREQFLTVLEHEFRKKNELKQDIRELAYEIIAGEVPKNPGIVNRLKEFNNRDRELIRDAVRFSMNHKI